MTERSRRVVLLIDYDNLQICAARDTPGRDLQLAPVVQLAQRYGTVILARAYAEWNLSTERLAVYKAGIEPAFAPVLRTESDRSGKSLADTVMVAEGMDMLWTLSPEVVVLATSDKDLIPLARVAKQRGAFVVVLGSDFTAIPLREMADEHVTYRQLITEAGVRYATEAGPGRAPAALPEPSRRRRERDGRDRGTAPAVSRPEREAAPAAPAAQPAAPAPQTPATTGAPASAGAAASGAAEPVAPFTAPVPGEADAQTSGRRRRRRGSRRRSDRLGLSAEELGGVQDGEADDAFDGDGDDVEGDELTVDAGAEDELSAELPGDVEADETVVLGEGDAVTEVEGAAEELAAEEAEAVAEAVEIEGAPLEPAPSVATVVLEADEVPVEVEAPVVRERRPRRTRRRVTETPEAEPGVAESVVQTELEDGASLPPPEPAAEIEPAPPPGEATLNGASTGEETPEAPAEPARRPRRVASASRGRSRRP
jgi:hypothetical protein